MFKKPATFVLILSCACSRVENTKIITASQIETIENALENINSDTLVVFDCDDVLITMPDQLFKSENRKISDKLIRKYFASHTNSFNEGLGILLSSCERVCVNNKMPGIIKNLQKRGVKVLVLTALGAEQQYGPIKSPIKWRVDDLHKLGYHFEHSWPTLPDKILSNESDSKGNRPFYSSGIICSGHFPKGKALKLFLEYTQIKINKIIFIDDSMSKVKSVGEIAQESHIDFLGIQYLEFNNISSGIPFSEQLASLQLKTLAQKHIWISDRKAYALLKNAAN